MKVCMGHEELGIEFPSYMNVEFVSFSLSKGVSTFDTTLACRDGPDAEYEYAREPSEEI